MLRADAAAYRRSPNDQPVYTLLGLRTTGPAAVQDFGERRANASDDATWPRATTNWFQSRRRLQVVEDARRGIRLPETSDVRLFERTVVKRKSDLDNNE